jgi:hypothetical protein
MSFSIPAGITNWSEKLAYCVTAQEKLRLDHNQHGEKYRNGEITPTEWETYKTTVFEPLSVEIGVAQCQLIDAKQDYPTVDLAWITAEGVILPTNLTWAEELGYCYALLGQDITLEQRSIVGSHPSMVSIPQDALDAVTLFTTQALSQQAFLVLKDGSRVPITMEVESTNYSDGRVDKKIIVPTLNTGVATNN